MYSSNKIYQYQTQCVTESFPKPSNELEPRSIGLGGFKGQTLPEIQTVLAANIIRHDLKYKPCQGLLSHKDAITVLIMRVPINSQGDFLTRVWQRVQGVQKAFPASDILVFSLDIGACSCLMPEETQRNQEYVE